MTIRRGSSLWLTLTGLFTAMNVILSMSIFSVPVPGGHLYFCDAVIRLDDLQDSSDTSNVIKYKGRPQPKFLTTVRDACLRGMTAEEAPLDESCGHIAGEFLFAYPPGGPLLIPGEMITDETIKFAKNAGSELYMNGRRSFDGKIKVLP